MTLIELIKEVEQNIGRYDPDNAELKEMVTKAINDIITEYLPVEGLRPYELYNDLNTTAEQEYIDLSGLTGFVGISPKGVYIDNNGFVELSVMRKIYRNETDKGKPTHYEIRFVSDTPRLYLFPVPNDVYTVRVWYYAKEVMLTSDNDEPILSKIYGSRIIVAGATMLVAKKLGINDVAMLWERDYFNIELPSLFKWQSSLDGDVEIIENIYM